MFYTLEELKKVDPSYDHRFNVTTTEVDRVNELIQGIKNTRNNLMPMPGDIVQYTTEHGNYYAHAHIEYFDEDNQMHICEQPYTPFITGNAEQVSFSTSGGAWAFIPRDLTPVGRELKRFTVWGRNGPCANGAIDFLTYVNVWEYDCNKQNYSTKNHDKFYVSLPEEDEYGYKFLISKGPYSHRAFRTEEDYLAWLKTYNGVEFTGHWGSSRIVWTLKQDEKYIPLDKYLSIENAIVDSQLCNGTIQECKRIYTDTSVTTYMPYQHEKIPLEDTKEHMVARMLFDINKSDSE